jgi:parallel beta-helix repeat protein
MFILLLASILVLAFNIRSAKGETKTWYVDDDGGADFTSIQLAIDAASAGDTIYVYNGTYEHIHIYKSLTLIGENKYGTIIDGSGYGVYFEEYGAVVTITGVAVNLTDFTVQNAGYAELSGIAVYLHDTSLCSINDLVILNSRFGIAPLFYSSDNIISNNTISDAEIGIVNFNPWPSSNNTVVGNRISNSSGGIYFNYPYSVQIINNIISNNSRYPYGIHFQMGGSDNKVIGNIVENSENAIRLDYAGSNLVEENVVENCTYGVFVGYESSDNVVVGNNASGSNIGFMLWDKSNRNLVTDNLAINNDYGIALQSSNSNRIYHNKFIDNNQQVLNLDSQPNIWDDGYPSGGNYWSDYNGTDLCSGPYQNETGRDGIGDLPYVIDADNQDNYPLMPPYVPVLGDLNLDGWVNLLDAIEAASAFGSYPGHPNWNSQADLNHDNVANILDTIILANNFGKH